MCDGDQKSLYGVVNNLLHKNKESVLPSSSSDLVLANKFSEYFVSKIEDIRSSFNQHCEKPNDDSSVHCSRISEFEPVTEEELRKILKKLLHWFNSISAPPLIRSIIIFCCLDSKLTLVSKGQN